MNKGSIRSASHLVAIAFAVSSSALACTPKSSDRHAIADTPAPAPTEVPAPARPGPAPNAADPNECGRGSGRSADGACETLRLRETDYVQQVQIPAGAFVMGDVPMQYDTSPAREAPKLSWPGQPPRRVELPSFWIDLYEVTRTAYADCVEAGACTAAVCPDGSDPAEVLPEGMRAGAPQTCVSHAQAAAFCRAKGQRLPSEAEWEYGARGPIGWLFPWGNNIKDEFHDGLAGIGGMPGDVGYFGLRGTGSSAKEWVAEAWDPDAPLRPFLAREFRRDDGPLRRTESDLKGAHVIKGGKSGYRRAATDVRPDVGFRCAADLADDVVPLTVPVESPEVPMYKRSEAAGLLVFGGIAEAVDRREAMAFCDNLRAPSEDGVLQGWRLPTLAEVRALTDTFRGPGPFWIVEGAAAQRGEGKRPVPTDPWASIDADPSESLAARCVRD